MFEPVKVDQAAVYAVVLSSGGLWWAFSESVSIPAVRGSGGSGAVFGVFWRCFGVVQMLSVCVFMSYRQRL